MAYYLNLVQNNDASLRLLTKDTTKTPSAGMQKKGGHICVSLSNGTEVKNE